MGRLQGEPGLCWTGFFPGRHLQDQHGGADRYLGEAISERSGLQVPRNHVECLGYSSKYIRLRNVSSCLECVGSEDSEDQGRDTE